MVITRQDECFHERERSMWCKAKENWLEESKHTSAHKNLANFHTISIHVEEDVDFKLHESKDTSIKSEIYS